MIKFLYFYPLIPIALLIVLGITWKFKRFALVIALMSISMFIVLISQLPTRLDDFSIVLVANIFRYACFSSLAIAIFGVSYLGIQVTKKGVSMNWFCGIMLFMVLFLSILPVGFIFLSSREKSTNEVNHLFVRDASVNSNDSIHADVEISPSGKVKVCLLNYSNNKFVFYRSGTYADRINSVMFNVRNNAGDEVLYNGPLPSSRPISEIDLIEIEPQGKHCAELELDDFFNLNKGVSYSVVFYCELIVKKNSYITKVKTLRSDQVKFTYSP